MNRTVVVGAGVIGLAAAYSLTRRQHVVTVVDRGPPGGECSHGNGGWIVPSFSAPLPAPDLGFGSLLGMFRRDSPLHIDLRKVPALASWLVQFKRYCNGADYKRGLDALATLNLATISAYDAWAADGVCFEMHKAGLLSVFLNASNVEAATRDFTFLRKLGYNIPEALTGAQVRALEPGLGDGVTGGFLVEAERHVRPETLMTGLSNRLGQLGCTVQPGVAVLGAARSGRKVHALHTSAGDLVADRFLIAAGAWTGILAKKLGSALPIQAGKGYSITLPKSDINFQRPVYFAEAKAAISPFNGYLRVTGTMELSGVNTRLEPRRLMALRRSAERYLRVRPNWELADNWVGARPITPDGLPIIDRLPGYDNVYVASGHAMLGVTLAPSTAELIADLMSDRAHVNGARPFAAGRFDSRWFN